jgi:hypothetical protein
MCGGSDFEGSNYLGEIEEKSDGNSIHQKANNRRTSSIPRQVKNSNRVQAVKIDLGIPANMGDGMSR